MLRNDITTYQKQHDKSPSYPFAKAAVLMDVSGDH